MSIVATKYLEFLIPQQLDVINQSAKGNVSIPVFFTAGDLLDLFQTSSQNIGNPIGLVREVDMQSAQAPEVLKKAIESKPHMGHTSNNTLVMAFSIFGYAASLGRHVECFGTEVDGNGEVVNSGPKLHARANPEMFVEFQDDPVKGARAFFSNVHSAVGSPDRIMLMGIVSPNPIVN